jgi:hypothetical protein
MLVVSKATAGTSDCQHDLEIYMFQRRTRLDGWPVDLKRDADRLVKTKAA